MRYALTLAFGLWSAVGVAAQCGGSWEEDFDAPGLAALPPELTASPSVGPFSWQVQSGPTASQGTGPNGDYPSGAGRYVYVEATGANPGQTAALRLPCANLNGVFNPHLQFALHMSGLGMGSLVVESQSAAGAWSVVAAYTGDQGPDWREVALPLAPRADGTVELRLVATRGAGFTSDIALDQFRIGSPRPAEWQLNQPLSTFRFDGVDVPSPLGPKAEVTRFVGQSVMMELGSMGSGRQFDLLYIIGSSVGASAGGTVTLGLQVVNLDIRDPVFRTLHGGANGVRLVPWPGDSQTQISLPFPDTFAGQLLVTAPSLPDGFALSQAAEVTWTQDLCSAAPDLNLGDDTFAAVDLGYSLPFYGIPYSRIYVTSNGTITFGSGRLDWPSRLVDFFNDVPMIAALGSDLDPSAGGRVRAFSDSVGSFCAVWDSVPNFGIPGINAIRVEMTSGGNLVMDFTGGVSTSDAIVGITPGGGRGLPTAVDYSVLPIFVPQIATIYEQFLTPVDLSGSVITFGLDASGRPVSIF